MNDLAPQHPEWKEKEPFASLLKRDMKNEWKVVFPFEGK
ncbi:MAG: hypothetical protein H6R37_641 [Deltaproteobacteria bacterium]|jgi:hypothetical protein|nr:hypothetical protein [Deltaproteobacteria bacterium]